MGLRTVTFTLAAGLGLAAPAFAQHVPAATGTPLPPGAEAGATVYRLRNVAAADAAQTITALAARQELAVSVTAEPVSNTVLVTGAAGPRQQALELLTTLDRDPPMVVVRMAFVRVPAGFAEELGLADGKCVLTPREAQLLTGAIRRDRDHEVLSAPQLVVTDNQTGVVQLGSDTAGVTARVTPRVSPEGTILLRVEAGVREQAGEGAFNVQTVQTTESLPAGGTLVVRGPRTKTAAGASEVLVLMTVHGVAREPAR